jgi:hypothetical protein
MTSLWSDRLHRWCSQSAFKYQQILRRLLNSKYKAGRNDTVTSQAIKKENELDYWGDWAKWVVAVDQTE